MNCSACLGTSTSRVFEKHGYWIRECRCGHRFAEIRATELHVEKIYSDKYFTDGADGYPDYLTEEALVRDHGRYYGRLLQHYVEPGLVLDVGAAAGFILAGLQEYGWRGVGIEPNATMAGHALRRGVDVRVATLETFESDQRFDLVSLIQVVAHFFDMQRAFENLSRLTAPGGALLVETWNKDSWLARIQGAAWHEYSPPSVLHYFSLSSLAEMLKRFGFVHLAHGRPPKRLSGSHVQSLLAHTVGGTALGPAVRRASEAIPPQWTVPYPSYDLFWALYRRQ